MNRLCASGSSSVGILTMQEFEARKAKLLGWSDRMGESSAMAINAWWVGDPAERYWVEITDRPDLGENLFTPQRATTGGSTAGYELINYIKPGDVVFHWHKGSKGGKALVAWSIASGEIEDTVIDWQPHGTYGRAVQESGPRPAWLMPLVDYTPLDTAITYEDVKRRESQIHSVESSLRAGIAGPLYFPFVFSDSRPIRTAQNYLAKFPLALAELLGIQNVSDELASFSFVESNTDVVRVRGEGQGYVSDSRVKRAIERRAVEVAIDWYAERDYTIEYTGDSSSYDLLVTRGAEVRRVEIKGTTNQGTTVELTWREVDNARDFTPVDLFLVYGIEFERLPDGNAQGFGGYAKLWSDWTPEEASLKATRFRHTLPLSGFQEFDARD